MADALLRTALCVVDVLYRGSDPQKQPLITTGIKQASALQTLMPVLFLPGGFPDRPGEFHEVTASHRHAQRTPQVWIRHPGTTTVTPVGLDCGPVARLRGERWTLSRLGPSSAGPLYFCYTYEPEQHQQKDLPDLILTSVFVLKFGQ